MIPLAAGIALLAYFDAAGKPGDVGSQLLELLVCFVLLIVGLVLAGPWFTTAGSRLMVRRAGRPSTLIAGRRLLDDPKAAFRFISGLVIALFIASALIGALGSIAAASSAGGRSTAGSDTLADPFCSFTTSNCPASANVASVSRSCARGAAFDARRAQCDAGSPEPPRCAEVFVRAIASPVEELVRGGRLRPARKDAGDRPVPSWSGHRRHWLLPFERPRAQLPRVDDGLADCEHVAGERCAPPRGRDSRRDGWILGLYRTDTYCARAGLSVPGNTGRSGRIRSFDRSAARHDPGHDRRDDRGEPHHRRVQSGRQHRLGSG